MPQSHKRRIALASTLPKLVHCARIALERIRVAGPSPLREDHGTPDVIESGSRNDPTGPMNNGRGLILERIMRINERHGAKDELWT